MTHHPSGHPAHALQWAFNIPAAVDRDLSLLGSMGMTCSKCLPLPVSINDRIGPTSFFWHQLGDFWRRIVVNSEIKITVDASNMCSGFVSKPLSRHRSSILFPIRNIGHALFHLVVKAQRLAAT